MSSSSGNGGQSRTKSNESTVSFDTWAFAISDSRTVVKNNQAELAFANKKEGSSKDGLNSDEVRLAEELAGEWLADKKIVRFNLTKNEDINLTQQAQVCQENDL